MANTFKNVIFILGLMVVMPRLHFAIASPLIPQDCAAAVTETVTATFTTQVLLPKSTIKSKVFKRGQKPPSNSEPVEEASSLPSNTVIDEPTPTSYVSVSTSTSILPHSLSKCENSTTTIHHIQIEKTTFITQEPETVLEVIYPCSTPIPIMTSTIPYGKWSDSLGNPGTTDGNNLFTLDTPYGGSAEACCNACWFDLTYCLQAYWYFYEGCVVNQGTVTNGLIGSGVPLTGQGISETCPQGTVEGLIYLMDSGADFRSTGDFAGPCAAGYADL